MDMEGKVRVNRKYKDQLFRLVFQDKKDLLQLYNAVNGTAYTNENELIVNTIEDAVYLGMKNDLSFLIKGTLNLYEHQSTLNPNMPLRGFLYFSDVIQGYIEQNELDIYGSALVTLPEPRYIVFYNGTKDQPDHMESCLSEAFEPKSGKACLECRVTMININLGHNKELMDKCRKLREYAELVEEIRRRQKAGKSLKQAVQEAVDDCIMRGILEKILRKNRGEVLDMILTEYDAERHIANEKKLSHEEGIKEGIAIFIDTLQELNYTKEKVKEKLKEKYRLSMTEANSYMNKYWKE